MPLIRRALPATAAASAVVLALLLAGTGPAAHADAARAGASSVRGAAAPSQGFTAVAPTRLLDTRTSATTHTLGQGQTASVQVTGVAAVPSSGVEAVVLNVTGIAQTHSSYLTVFPAGASRPLASNLNLAQGQPRANQVFAQVGAGGKVSIFNSTGSTDVLVDITGYFVTGSSYSAQSPLRVLDTRASAGKPIAAAHTTTLQLHSGLPIPTGSSFVLNLTGISTAAGAFVTAYQTGTARPATSNLNLAARQTAAVLVVVQPSASGQISFYNSGGPTHLVVDVLGSFNGDGDYTSVTPTRLFDTRGTDTVEYGAENPVAIGGRAGVPATAGAAVLSVTAVKPVKRGFLTVHPDGTAKPATSSVNVEAGATTANLVVAQLSPDGKVDIYDAAFGGEVVVDVVGWLDTNQSLRARTPAPILPAEIGKTYSLAIATEGGLAPYSFAAASDAPLPDGLSVAPTTGTITGTPTTAGAVTSAIEVRDSSGAVDRVTVPLRVYPFVSSTLWGWGSGNGYSLLPSNAGLNSTPVQLAVQSGVKQVAPGNGVVVSLHDDGTVWAWGAKVLVGSGAAADVPWTAPVRVGTLTGITAVATGQQVSYALKSDGTVWSWGQGANGRLGNGATADAPTPVQVTGLTGVTAIATAFRAGLALKSDGTVWTWGTALPNAAGTAGVSSSTPVQVLGLTGIAGLGSGDVNGYAITADGHVMGWGSATGGQLGSDNPATTWAPVAINGLSDITQVIGGLNTMYALTGSGSVLALGEGTNGELGNGGVSDSTAPVTVSGLSDAVEIAAVTGAGYARLSDGTVWSWGQPSFGVLGNGAAPGFSNSLVPARVLAPPAQSIGAHAGALAVFVVGLP